MNSKKYIDTFKAVLEYLSFSKNEFVRLENVCEDVPNLSFKVKCSTHVLNSYIQGVLYGIENMDGFKDKAQEAINLYSSNPNDKIIPNLIDLALVEFTEATNYLVSDCAYYEKVVGFENLATGIKSFIYQISLVQRAFDK